MDTTTQKEESEMATDIDYSEQGALELMLYRANEKHNDMQYVEVMLFTESEYGSMEKIQNIRLELPGKEAIEFWKSAGHIIHSLYIHRDTVDKTDMRIGFQGRFDHPGYEHHGGHNPTELANWGVTVKEAIETALRQVGPDFFSNERELRLMAGFDTPCSQGGLAPHWTQCRDHAAKAGGMTQIRWEDEAYALSRNENNMSYGRYPE